ncbi:hypothetical protein SAMN04515667_2759 [Formosa sp. Hel1_31_208]|uniref:sulfotransferase n=1 Tax=Formosa sp. Hel1_31_208 TaxID=1798225 RepID=UPI00087DCFD1|nr:sulfotransferase [Formosa sp. Hel1_31_208]SDS69462.1 hypothetical protein SAMN04515667_2759 [Formosa sp. Hel1_31_208]
MGILNLFNKNKNKPLVFCIGMNKTGTTSLGVFFENHGYKVFNQAKGELLLSNYINEDFEKIINSCEKSKMQVFQDVPFSLPKTFKYLFEYFPNSKFILTVRSSPEEWYNSILKFHSEFYHNGQKPTLESLKNSNYVYKGWSWDLMNNVFFDNNIELYNKEVLMKKYKDHINDVQNYFSVNESKDRLITINLSEKNDFEKLITFLKIKTIAKNFPRITSKDIVAKNYTCNFLEK